jgi:hypothetical protein
VSEKEKIMCSLHVIQVDRRSLKLQPRWKRREHPEGECISKREDARDARLTYHKRLIFGTSPPEGDGDGDGDGEALGEFPCDGVAAGGAAVLEPSVSVAEAAVVEAVEGIAVLATEEALALEIIDSAIGFKSPSDKTSERT